MRKKASKKRSKKGSKLKGLDTKINRLEKQLHTLKVKKKSEQQKVIVAYGIDVQEFVSPLKKNKKITKKLTKVKIDPVQLKKGIKLETLEHGKRLAKKVALDHLHKDPHYYI